MKNLALVESTDARPAERPPQPARPLRSPPPRSRSQRARSTRWTSSTGRRSTWSPATRPARRSTSRKEDPKLRDRYGRHTLGPEHAARPAAGRSRHDVRHLPLRRLGPSLGPAEAGYNRYLPKIDQLVSALFTDLAERGLYDKVLRRAVRRIQPHAADERRRQRRRTDEHGHARPRPLGQRDVLPARRRRRARAAASSAPPIASAKCRKIAPFARATSTTRSTACSASIRTSTSSTTPAGRSPPSTTAP